MSFATLEASALADEIRVVGFRGTERLCRHYAFELFAQVEGQGKAADLDEAIASAATLTLRREHDHPQRFHGILANVSLVQQMPTWALYRLELVPRVWQLGLTQHSRVFTKQKVPDIIGSVLEEAGFGAGDFELRLDGQYPEEELVVQYLESDLDFLQRWMEREGLYYFFEQGDGGEKLVIVDHVSFHKSLVERPVRYHPLVGHDTSADECFDTFAAIRAATVGRVKLADYDYARPMLDVSADQEISKRGFGVQRVHAGRFFDPGQAKRFARLRAEQIKSRALVYHAAGTALHMSAGYVVEVSEHASEGFNKRYLLTEVHHFGNQLQQEGESHLTRIVKPDFDEVYRVEVKAADASQPYRAPEATPWPRVWGFEGAVVDGPADSQYAQLDDQGRYLVKFRFDESDLPDGKRSTYVRMMQPYGGTTEGFHFPLRKGTEVKIAFDGGDPDRPFIAGAIPNATTPSPVTDANPELNIIQTASGNAFVASDEKDKEWTKVSTPCSRSSFYMGTPTTMPGMGIPPVGSDEWQNIDANVVLASDGTAAFNFGGSFYTEVGVSMETHVHGPVYDTFDSSQTIEIYGGISERVSFDVKEEYQSDHQTNVNGNRGEYVGGDCGERYGSLSTTVTGMAKLTAPVLDVAIAGLYQLKAGNIAADVGPTTLNTGPVIGNHGPIMISSPAIQITTPSWKVTNPEQGFIGATCDFSWAKKASIIGLSFSAVGIKIDGAGANLYRIGYKGGKTGIKNETFGADISNGGPRAENVAVMLRTAGMHLLS